VKNTGFFPVDTPGLIAVLAFSFWKIHFQIPNHLKIHETMKAIIVVIVLAVPFLNSCKTVKSLLNADKVSSADEAKAALKENSNRLLQIKGGDFYLNISQKDFDSLVQPEVEKFVDGQHFPHIKSQQITNVQTSTGPEQINLSADFQLVIDTFNTSMKGRLVGTMAFSVAGDSLVLYPAFKYIHVNSLTFENLNKLENKVVASVLNVILNSFIEKLNGVMVSKVPPIPLNLMNMGIATNDLSKDPTTTVTFSQPLQLSTPVASSACLIDKSGIQMIGVFENSATKAPDPSGLTFSDFSKVFSAQRDNNFPGLPGGNTTSFVISKSAVAQVFNASLANENIGVQYAGNKVLQGQADKSITIDLNEINCGSVGFNCPQLHIVPDCSCPVNLHCPNGPFGIACRAAEDAAKATWYTTVGNACLATRAAEIAANVVIQGQCDAAKLAAIGACQVTKSSLTVVLGSQVAIGDIHTTVAATGTATGNISQVALKNDLSAISLSMQANASAPLQVTFGFTPEGPAGHLVCALQFDHPYSCAASASRPLTTFQSAMSFSYDPDSSLRLNFQTSQLDFNITANPTPIALMTRDIPALIDCPLLKFGIGLADIVKGVKDLFSDGNFGNNNVNALVNGVYAYTVPAKSFTLPIKPVHLKYQGKQIPLNPIAGSSYIGFYYRAVIPK
jgi:hypothetical protein